MDAADIKARVSLREIMERDGVAFRRGSGDSLLCCCPIHGEKTPSFHLHEGAGGDWYRCFGCGAKGDVFAYLQAVHDLDFKGAVAWLGYAEGAPGAGNSYGKSGVVRRAEPVVEKVVEPWSAEVWREWVDGCRAFAANGERVDAWAKWRGLRPEVIRWAAERCLLSEGREYKARRELFLIDRWRKDAESDDGGWLEHVSVHVRLGPHTEYNGGDKAQWRYSPPGCGAWPFVVLPAAGLPAARFLFFTEGQWDALALIDLMGWEVRWPESVAVFGLRGASSVGKVMEFPFDAGARAFLIADRDAAGAKWFTDDTSLAALLKPRVRMVYSFWPVVPGRDVKDLNDAVAAMDERDRGVNAMFLRGKVKRQVKSKPKPTFLQWLRLWKKMGTERGVFADVVTAKGSGCPKGRAKKPVWVRWIDARMPESRVVFERCWSEWRAA
jgi:hypothetical protein